MKLFNSPETWFDAVFPSLLYNDFRTIVDPLWNAKQDEINFLLKEEKKANELLELENDELVFMAQGLHEQIKTLQAKLDRFLSN